jgi:hypothetical protein
MTCVAQWIPEKGAGAEHLVLQAGQDDVIAEAVVVGTRFGTPYGAHYRVEMAADWTVRRVLVALTDGRKLMASADGRGRWHDVDGKPLPMLDGCIDVDLSATPFTNTLPIRRLQLTKGERREIRVAYLAIPALTLEPVDQAYTCIEPRRRYLYEGLFREFEAELAVDTNGLVEDYPTLFKRIA